MDYNVWIFVLLINNNSNNTNSEVIFYESIVFTISFILPQYFYKSGEYRFPSVWPCKLGVLIDLTITLDCFKGWPAYIVPIPNVGMSDGMLASIISEFYMDYEIGDITYTYLVGEYKSSHRLSLYILAEILPIYYKFNLTCLSEALV